MAATPQQADSFACWPNLHFDHAALIVRIVHLYNFLPQSVVDACTVRAFQGRLQCGLVTHALRDGSRWQYLFQDGWKSMSSVAFDTLFP